MWPLKLSHDMAIAVLMFECFYSGFAWNAHCLRNEALGERKKNRAHLWVQRIRCSKATEFTYKNVFYVKTVFIANILDIATAMKKTLYFFLVVFIIWSMVYTDIRMILERFKNFCSNLVFFEWHESDKKNSMKEIIGKFAFIFVFSVLSPLFSVFFIHTYN